MKIILLQIYVNAWSIILFCPHMVSVTIENATNWLYSWSNRL